MPYSFTLDPPTGRGRVPDFMLEAKQAWYRRCALVARAAATACPFRPDGVDDVLRCAGQLRDRDLRRRRRRSTRPSAASSARCRSCSSAARCARSRRRSRQARTS